MSEPLVQRGLQKMSYGTSLAVVFFAALFAVAMSGCLATRAPLIWNAAANASSLTDMEFRAGQSGAGVGLLLAAVPGLLADRATPMLSAFLFAGEAFTGYFVLFFVAKGLIQSTSWPVIGLLFFLVGQACVGIVLLSISVLSFNAPQARRGFVIGAVFAAFAVGMLFVVVAASLTVCWEGTLIWTLIEWAVFEDAPSLYPFYVLSLALAVPLFYFLSAFLLFKVEKPLPEPEARPSLPPLFSQSSLADGSSIDDELVFRSDVDYKSTLLPVESASASEKRPWLSRIAFLLAFVLVVPSCAVWLILSSELQMFGAPYLFPGAFIASSMLTGFFSDFFFRFARQWWVTMAGLVGAASYLLIAFFPLKMWFGMQILQGAALSCTLVAGISHLSHDFSLNRLGTVTGLLGLPGCVMFLVLMVFVYFNPNGLHVCSGSSKCVFNSFLFCAATSLLGAVLAAASAITTHAPRTQQNIRPSVL